MQAFGAATAESFAAAAAAAAQSFAASAKPCILKRNQSSSKPMHTLDACCSKSSYVLQESALFELITCMNYVLFVLAYVPCIFMPRNPAFLNGIKPVSFDLAYVPCIFMPQNPALLNGIKPVSFDLAYVPCIFMLQNPALLNGIKPVSFDLAHVPKERVCLCSPLFFIYRRLFVSCQEGN
jgi:hypothetical protein